MIDEREIEETTDVLTEEVSEDESSRHDMDAIVDPSEVKGDESIPSEEEASQEDSEDGKVDEGDSHQPDVVEFDPEILQMAATLEMPERLAKAFPSVEALEAALAPLAARWQQKKGFGEQEQEQEAEQQPQGFKFELNEEFDPQLVEQLNGMNNFYAQQMQEFQAQVNGQFQQFQAPIQQFQSHLEQQRQSLVENQIDVFFTSIASDHGEVFGQGGEVTTEQSAARQVLRDKASELAHGRVAMNPNTPPDIEAVLKDALLLTQGDRINERARKQVDDRLRDQKGRWASRPSKRSSKTTQSGESRALEGVQAILDKAGHG